MAYEILKDRGAVRILKLLYDNEVISKKSYSLELSFINEALGPVQLNSVNVLIKYGLIVSDDGENGKILSITEKGKQFITILDQIIFLLTKKEVKKEASIAVTYDLTDTEEKILLVLSKMQKETGDLVQLKSLTQEIGHYKKSISLSKPIARLEQIGLVYKIKKDKAVLLSVTESGEKVINRQIVKEISWK